MTPEAQPPEPLTKAEIDALELIMRGTSVIDWPRLHFVDRDEVNRFLRLNEFDPDDGRDVERLWQLQQRAVDYLERALKYMLPAEVLQPAHIADLFLMASQGRSGSGGVARERARLSDAGVAAVASQSPTPHAVTSSPPHAPTHATAQSGACVVLKVMHIINHLDARELGFLCPVSDRELFQRMEEKTMGALSRLRASGHPIIEVTGGRKLKDSLITKLLSKRETLAAQIYDKLRFRVVTQTREALIPLVRGLSVELFPFSYAVPTQSENQLVDLNDWFASGPLATKRERQAVGLDLRSVGLRATGATPLANCPDFPPFDRYPADVFRSHFHRACKPPACTQTAAKINEFSGPTFRALSFVADIPLRLPDTMLPTRSAHRLGRIAFVLVELQLVDAETARQNEQGENAHERYRERQLAKVAKRLFSE